MVLARHEASGVLVAIKYLRPDLLADPGFAGMFRGEATVLASLDDPNIVRLYEYVESPAGAAIVMELVNGVPLAAILAHQGRTAPEAALVVLQGSLLGLAAAHQRGVVHRDYKPGNVLIGGDGTSKLTDFGLAARTGDRPIPAGTLMYVAPEQIDGAPASPAGDVYSATATFYECLTGHPPFTGESGELLHQHRTQPVPLDPVPAALRPLVAAGMAKDPGRWRIVAITLVTQLQAAAASTYGKDWEKHGRSHLGEAALLLAALWPAALHPPRRPRPCTGSRCGTSPRSRQPSQPVPRSSSWQPVPPSPRTTCTGPSRPAARLQQCTLCHFSQRCPDRSRTHHRRQRSRTHHRRQRSRTHHRRQRSRTHHRRQRSRSHHRRQRSRASTTADNAPGLTTPGNAVYAHDRHGRGLPGQYRHPDSRDPWQLLRHREYQFRS